MWEREPVSPGIPLKILFPQWKIVLMDSLNKRIKFLDEVIQSLELENIRTVHGRAEELAQKKEYREQFSLCVSRAVANLATLSEYCLPFIKKDGRLVSYKSGEVADELKMQKKQSKFWEESASSRFISIFLAQIYSVLSLL